MIGATGHIGSYLVPRLVRAGHEVVALSRGVRDPYVSAPEWRRVERIAVDREAEDAGGDFGGRIAALAGDAVVDLLCFTPESAQQLVDALRPTRPLLVHCGTIWVHGPSTIVPMTEAQPRRPFGEYGIQKAAIEATAMRQVLPNATSIAGCSVALNGSDGDAGRLTTTQAMPLANTIAPKPAQITRRARA